MTEYEVEWQETHRTKVNADNEDDARDYVVKMNREASKTFAGVIGSLRVSKRYRVFWVEHHACVVTALSEAEAIDEAAYYSGEHDTCTDADNYDVKEV